MADGPRTLSKLGLGLSIFALIAYIVAFGSPYWIEKDYRVLVDGDHLDVAIDDGRVHIFAVDATSYSGLFTDCFDEKIYSKLGRFNTTKNFCNNDDRETWQYTAMAIAVVGLVLAILSMALSIYAVAVSKKTRYYRMRYMIVFSHFLTAAAKGAAVALFGLNKEIKVRPPLNATVDHDLAWGFYVAVGCVLLYTLLVILYTVLAILKRVDNEDHDDRRPRMEFGSARSPFQ